MDMMIIVMGLPGSGKSYFAARLAAQLSAVHIQSDIVRKNMQLEGKYTQKDKISVYKEMCEQSKVLLENGKSVIVDATFHLDTFRKLFYQMATKANVQLITVLVEAEETTVRGRLKHPREHSEADFDVYLQVKKDFDPLLHPFLHLISTDSNIESMIHKAVNYLKIGDDT